MSGFSNAKERLDKLLGEETPQWVFHDLRRTAATGMARLGVLPHVVEAVLNHTSGSKAGVAGIYNRASYATEKRHALERWGDFVERLVTRAGRQRGVDQGSRMSIEDEDREMHVSLAIFGRSDPRRTATCGSPKK